MKIKVAAVQLGSMGSKEEILIRSGHRLDALVGDRRRLSVVCLPELITFLPTSLEIFHPWRRRPGIDWSHCGPSLPVCASAEDPFDRRSYWSDGGWYF